MFSLTAENIFINFIKYLLAKLFNKKIAFKRKLTDLYLQRFTMVD